MRRSLLSLALAGLLTAVLPVQVEAQPAPADNNDFCDSSEVCVFEHDSLNGCMTDIPYRGAFIAIPDLKQRRWDGCPNKHMGDSISSMTNEVGPSGPDVFLYEHDHYRGRVYCVPAGARVENLKTTGFGDKASSIKIEVSHEC